MDKETSVYDRSSAEYQGPDESRGRNSMGASAGTNIMAGLSFVAGVLSVLTTFLVPVYLPLIFGSLAIAEGLLSRGSRSISQKGALGVALGLFGIILNISVLAVGIYMYLTNEALRAEISRLIESMQMYMYQ